MTKHSSNIQVFSELFWYSAYSVVSFALVILLPQYLSQYVLPIISSTHVELIKFGKLH